MKSIRTTLFYATLLPLIIFSTSPLLGAQENGSCVTAPLGIVSWWPGDGNAKDIEDSNDGIVVDDVMFVTGKVGNAFDFSDGPAHVNIPTSPNINFTEGDAYTIEFWIKTDVDDTGHPALVEKWTSADFPNIPYPYVVRLNTGDTTVSTRIGPIGTIMCASFSNPDFPRVSSISAPRVDDSEFHHVACVFNHSDVPKRISVYIDGAFSDSDTFNDLGPISNEVDLLLGIRATSTGTNDLTDFNGILDEVTIYSRALTDSEIAEIFFAGSAGKCKARFLIEDLIQRVQELGLPGMAGQAQLIAALDALAQDPPDIQGAIDALQDFINFVNAQSGKQIPVPEAGYLMDAAQAIIDDLSQ